MMINTLQFKFEVQFNDSYYPLTNLSWLDSTQPALVLATTIELLAATLVIIYSSPRGTSSDYTTYCEK